MCLYYSEKIDQKLRDRLTKASNGIICYKVVQKDGSSPVFSNFKYKSGVNISNRISSYATGGSITQGIHVFINKHDAIKWSIKHREIILPVRCYLEDFVAGGKFDEFSNAVFTKVTISLRTYGRYIHK